MFSFAGDLVLDPFAGTGSTAVAAIAAGRNSISVEIDPAYAELARGLIDKAAKAKRAAGATIAEVKMKTERKARRSL
jgi:site-specific DNA-methyltransferase (adenine-specific)